MTNEEEWNNKQGDELKENIDNEEDKVIWELHDLREQLKFELEDLYDDLKYDIEDFKEEAEDIKDDLRDDLKELMEEREEYLEQIKDIMKEIDQYGENAKDRVENAKNRYNKLKEKVEKQESKFNEKLRKRIEKAKSKAAKRINISVDPDMSDEWKDWAEDLGASVSELVRKSMKFVKNNIGDLSKLDEIGKLVEESGIDGLGDKIEQLIKTRGTKDLNVILKNNGKKEPFKANVQYYESSESKKERIKKRIQGLIKLQAMIPIDKLSQALEISEEDAENMIYELAAEGVEGKLEEGVFKYTSNEDEVISKLFKLVDKL
jgi:DNA repair exonuclease SbcCD ATPase subunit